ncbi:MAG: PepSY-like domain-containing protein [Bacteroidota bacterium]|nr:PepSY-like domain-containing protein [Bacteroidota bacterium]
MKRVFLMIAFVMTTGVITVSCGDDDVAVSPTELTNSSSSFLETYFPGIGITKVEQDVNSVDDYQEVTLANGVRVDFNKQGDWTEVDGNGQAIPTGFILPNIVEYVSVNYPNTQIEGISKQNYGFAVDLLNGVELRFNHQGNFIGLDK